MVPKETQSTGTQHNALCTEVGVPASADKHNSGNHYHYSQGLLISQFSPESSLLGLLSLKYLVLEE